MLSRLRGFFDSQISRYFKRQPQQEEDDQAQRDPRYEPCDVLTAKGVPCKIWCEDALVFYNVPTVVSDLFLLVSDPASAAVELGKAGYVKTQANPRYNRIPQLSNQAMRFIRPDDEDASILTDCTGLPEADDIVMPGVVLLPAKEWGYALPESVSDLEYLVPEIADYFDHIVSKWMDLEKEDDISLRNHLGIHIWYCTGYVDEVWSMDFAGKIRREHRQLLFDMQAKSVGMEANRVDLVTEEGWALHRGIRDRILRGMYDPPDVKGFKFKRPVREEVGTRVTMTVTPADMKLVDYSD